MDRAEMTTIAAGHSSISDKIRALDAAGCSRSEIATFLNRSYQQVRQVLVQDEARRARNAQAAPGLAERKTPQFARTESEAGGLYRLDIQPDGSIRLPAFVEQAMGLRRGGVVISEFMGDRLVLLSTTAAGKRAQDLVAALIPGTDSLADSLIEDRRHEARREIEDD